jgi:hypothetical protein
MVTGMTWLVSLAAVASGLWAGGADRWVALALVALVGVRYAARRRLGRPVHAPPSLVPPSLVPSSLIAPSPVAPVPVPTTAPGARA